jgi:hypothetical protein
MSRLLLATILGWPVFAQTAPDWRDVLARLDRLEQENRTLREEVRLLREDLASVRPAAPERLEIQERRQGTGPDEGGSLPAVPIRLTGMAVQRLLRRQFSGTSDIPATASARAVPMSGGTLRQSILGLEFHGPSP